MDARSARKILVLAGECTVAPPSSDLEQIYGDAAAAILVGGDGGIAKMSDFTSVSEPIPGLRKRSVDLLPQRFEAKLDMRYGFIKSTLKAIETLTKKYNLTIKDFSKLAFNAPDPRGYMELVRGGNADPSQFSDPFMFAMSVGMSGAAHALLLLTASLETAKAGEKILCASYGDGCDAFYVETTDGVERMKGTREPPQFI